MSVIYACVYLQPDTWPRLVRHTATDMEAEDALAAAQLLTGGRDDAMGEAEALWRQLESANQSIASLRQDKAETSDQVTELCARLKDKEDELTDARLTIEMMRDEVDRLGKLCRGTKRKTILQDASCGETPTANADLLLKAFEADIERWKALRAQEQLKKRFRLDASHN